MATVFFMGQTQPIRFLHVFLEDVNTTCHVANFVTTPQKMHMHGCIAIRKTAHGTDHRSDGAGNDFAQDPTYAQHGDDGGDNTANDQAENDLVQMLALDGHRK